MRFGKGWWKSWTTGMSCALGRSSCLQMSLGRNWIASRKPLGLISLLRVLLAAESLCTMKAAVATCTPTVDLLHWFLLFHFHSCHRFYPTILLHLVCLFIPKHHPLAGEEYQLSPLPEMIFCPSSCINLNPCPQLHLVSLQSTIVLLLTKCNLQVVDQVSHHLC